MDRHTGGAIVSERVWLYAAEMIAEWGRCADLESAKFS
jgi:hypothetical protein